MAKRTAVEKRVVRRDVKKTGPILWSKYEKSFHILHQFSFFSPAWISWIFESPFSFFSRSGHNMQDKMEEDPHQKIVSPKSLSSTTSPIKVIHLFNRCRRQRRRRRRCCRRRRRRYRRQSSFILSFRRDANGHKQAHPGAKTINPVFP